MRVGKRHPLYTAKREIRRQGITWQFLDSQAGKRLISAPRRLLMRYDLRVFRGGWKVPPIWENQQKYGYPILQTMPGLHPGLLLGHIRLHFRLLLVYIKLHFWLLLVCTRLHFWLLLVCASLHFRPHITSRPKTAAGLHGSFLLHFRAVFQRISSLQMPRRHKLGIENFHFQSFHLGKNAPS